VSDGPTWAGRRARALGQFELAESDRLLARSLYGQGERGSPVASAFDTALDTAGDAVTGYATAALPIVAAVAVAFLGVKYVRRIISRL